MPSALLKDELGHRIVQIELAGMAPLATKVVTMYFQVERFAESQTSGEPIGDSAQWLVPQKYIESDAPEIRALAAELQAPTARQTAAAVYDWVRQHLNYAGYVADDLGALATGPKSLSTELGVYSMLSATSGKARRSRTTLHSITTPRRQATRMALATGIA
jgi:hypothetical protein